MAEYIEKQAVMDKFTEVVAPSNNSDFERVPSWNDAVGIIEGFPPADVRPVAEIDEAVDEAIRILNAINSKGNMDYADYCEMHDVICAISTNCGADMREVGEDG